MKDPIILARLDSFQEAEVISGLLELNGFEVRIEGYNPDAARPNVQAHSFFAEQSARILVPAKDKLRARRLIEQIRKDAEHALEEEFGADDEEYTPARKRINWNKWNAYIVLGSMAAMVVLVVFSG